jgi:hypothetical protein
MPGPFVADANDNLVGAHASADLDLALGRILQRVGNEVGEHLLKAGFITEDDREFFREVSDKFVLGRLGRKTFGHS